MRLSVLQDKNLVIWGAGREGEAAIRWLRRFYPEKDLVVLTDKEIAAERREELGRFGRVRFQNGTATRDTLCRAEVVIKSPGISWYRDEIVQARQAGTQFTSNVDLWLAETDPCKVMAVTGTKGKSTTTAMIGHALAQMGTATAVAGNIGVPVLDLWRQRDRIEMWVVELSSYQTADLTRRPSMAVLLNLFPEHIDWHRSFDNYYRDKLNLFQPGPERHTILNFDDPQTRRLTAGWREVTFFENPEGLHVRGSDIYRGERRLGPVPSPDLAGRHNLANVCAALTALAAAGFAPERALETLAGFKGLPHRQQFLGRQNGIDYVDDAISTTPESALAALERFSGVALTLILGGFDRQQDYRVLARQICHKGVHAVVTMPQNGDRIAKALREATHQKGSGPILIETADLSAAVNAARDATPPGGLVLLSPAAPSYGCFENYIERGKNFAKAAGFEI